MAVLLVLGLPFAAVLFGAESGPTRGAWGFLYDAYGTSAWCWECEELVRKLLLCSLVILIDGYLTLAHRCKCA